VNTVKRRSTFVAGAIALTLIAAACGGDDSSTEETTAPAESTAAPDDPADETDETTASEGGELFVTGSSTVEPISIRVAEKAEALGISAVVEGPGTGDGFQKFCVGEGDITGGSRAIKEEEMATCAENGIEYVELSVAIDGLTVATSPANTAVSCLDVPALYALLGPESEGMANWSDADELAAEVGSAFTEFPDAPLVISGPGEESGTYDTFVEFAIAGIAEERGTDEFVRADYASSANDNLIVEGIEGSDSSLGWVGYAFFVAEAEKMKGIEIADEDGNCVAPTAETIEDGSYPFSRTLYIYVNTARAAENPAVKGYVDLYLSDDGIASVTEAGYVAEPAERLQAARDAWAAAIG
jgi:phosphate transport system substrate-binding protein